MQIPEIHVDELKQDKEFLDNIKRLEQESRELHSVEKAYKLLDAKLIIEAKEEEIDEVFGFIVNTALDKLATTLSENKSFDVVGDEEDRAVARAIYEYGMQRYSENDKRGAKELFLVLYHTIDYDELKDAMMVHACLASGGVEFDRFIDEFVDVDSVDPYDVLAFFVMKFTKPTSTLLQEYNDELLKCKEELKVLQESK
jgi:hypothetical protein